MNDEEISKHLFEFRQLISAYDTKANKRLIELNKKIANPLLLKQFDSIKQSLKQYDFETALNKLTNPSEAIYPFL